VISGLILSGICCYVALSVWRKYAHRVRSLLGKSEIAGMLLFPVVSAVGILSFYFVYYQFNQLVPIPDGLFHPHTEFNGMTEYYRAHSLLGHYFFSAARAYAEFMMGLPSMLLVCGLMCSVFGILSLKNKARSIQLPLIFELLFAGAMLVPLAFALTQTPINIRYFNLFILICGIVIALKTTLILTSLGRRTASLGLLVIAMGVVIEILPFKPLYSSFRPLWCNYSDEYSDSPSLTKIRPGWLGWGEELMLAGDWICVHEKDAGTQKRPITVDINFQADWLTPNNYIAVKHGLNSAMSYTANDYFIINRLGLIYRWGKYFENVQPLHSIKFRGYTEAWIYRGDQLARAGCTF
jgi:hypothetical protein